MKPRLTLVRAERPEDAADTARQSTTPARPLPPLNPTARGYNVVYRRHETNHCPGCGRTHWYVGRLSAECAFCSTALPFEHSHG